MLSIDEAFVDAAAPNADAAKNGRGLVLKNKFTGLHRSADDTLLFGYCQGSGKEPYLCSADFLLPEKPVYRCTCPSRQFPCKHSLGLLAAFAQGKAFSPAEIPEDIASKRGKVAARSEKKKEDAEKPKKVNQAALAKKLQAQLEGVEFLHTLTLDLIRLGIGNTNAKTAKEIEEQARQLGNAYLPGAQVALRNYTQLFYDDSGEERGSQQREAIYSEALDQLGRLHSLVKQGRAYLTRRLDNPDLKPETETDIAAWLGHAWRLDELKEVGLVKTNVELAQLAFHSYNDAARKEFVDTGIWMNLADGALHLTQTFRPHQATKYIRSDDSFFPIAQIPELYLYPGEGNRRVRWDGMTARAMTPRDLPVLRAHARDDFVPVIKEVKNQLKSPLADRFPVYALRCDQIGQVERLFVIADAHGERLVLTEQGLPEEPPSCEVLSLLPPQLLSNQVMIVRFHHDLDARQLRVKPLSLVTETAVIRLTL
jgi:hypothetical protein